MASEEKRIYVVVANTVQHPLQRGERGWSRIPRDTRDIVQPAGRQIAQACHAVRRMGHSMVIRAVLGLFTNWKRGHHLSHLRSAISFKINYEPITTIVLSCRDSFELEHVYNLLRDQVGVEAFKFNDTNPDAYGEGEVVTAFATVPVESYKMVGVLDYLPLWSPEVTENKG